MNSDAAPAAQAAVAIVFAPAGGDEAALRRMLEDEGVAVQSCADAGAFYAALDENAWCAIVTEEGLDRCTLEGLDAGLRRQPAWSDLPFLALAGRAAELHPSILASMRASLAPDCIITQGPMRAHHAAARLAAGDGARPQH